MSRLEFVLNYEEALRIQNERSLAGSSGWLLFSCPPTITLGKRGESSDVLHTPEHLKQQGITMLSVERGGQVTYHGPGQIVGFPFGTLKSHTGDTRGVRVFVEQLKQKLENFISRYRTVDRSEPENTAGVWILDAGVRRKIVSIGFKFSQDAIGHGFALNVNPRVKKGFSLIHPCGEKQANPGSLFDEEISDTKFSELRDELERELIRTTFSDNFRSF